MTDKTKIRSISFEQKEEIIAAIKNRETFEVVGCQGKMPEAVDFVEKEIGKIGKTSRVYTKGRLLALAPTLVGSPLGVFAAIGMAAHHIATWNPDYEIMKRPVDKILKVSYMKDDPDFTVKAANAMSNAVSEVGQHAAGLASAIADNPIATATGAVVGVAAVAAAPFTGGGSLLGGATLMASLTGAGAIAAGAVVGGGVGAAVSSVRDENIKEESFNKGVEKAMAESAIKIKQLSEMMAHAAEVYTAQKRLNEFIICLVAVGFAIADCDGEITEEERFCIEEFAMGMSKTALPQTLRDRIDEFSKTPPNFDQAILYVNSFGSDIWPPIDGLLEVVSDTDGIVNEKEQKFIKDWNNYKTLSLNGGAV